MTTALRPAPLRAQSDTRTLGGVLAHLNVGVFPPDEVEAFKKDYHRAAIRKYLLRVALKCLAPAAIVVIAIWLMFHQPDTAAGTLRDVGLLTCCCVCLGVMYVLLDTAKRDVRTSVWGSYAVAIPELSPIYHAPDETVELARKVQGQLPGAYFWIEKYKFDPLLWVQHGSTRYCIAHWDLPFDG